MKKQSDAERLASELFALGYGGTCSLAAAELRRLHEENERLKAQLSPCLHDETERLGAIWIKCTQCGHMWEDHTRQSL